MITFTQPFRTTYNYTAHIHFNMQKFSVTWCSTTLVTLKAYLVHVQLLQGLLDIDTTCPLFQYQDNFGGIPYMIPHEDFDNC